jgi:hypothetical protein
VQVGQPRCGPRAGADLDTGSLRGLQRRRDHQQPTSPLGQPLTDCRQRGGLTGAGRALHDDKARGTGQYRDRGSLYLIQPHVVIEGDPARRGGMPAASGEPSNQIGLHVHHVPRGERAYVSRCRLLAQRHTHGQRAGSEVLGQLGAHRRVGHQPCAGEQLFDLAAHVGGVPRRARRTEPGHHLAHCGVAVNLADERERELDRPVAVVVTEPGQHLEPAAFTSAPRLGRDLVRPAFRPTRASTPATARARSVSGCSRRHSTS